MACKAAIRTILYGRQEALKGEQTMRRLVLSFVDAELGATAIEYSIIAAGIALVIVAVVNGIGTTLNTTFTSVQSGLK
jgi:pilus assembly protein Flp/PilA